MQSINSVIIKLKERIKSRSDKKNIAVSEKERFRLNSLAKHCAFLENENKTLSEENYILSRKYDNLLLQKSQLQSDLNIQKLDYEKNTELLRKKLADAEEKN